MRNLKLVSSLSSLIEDICDIQAFSVDNDTDTVYAATSTELLSFHPSASEVNCPFIYLPSDKSLTLNKLKAFAEDKFSAAKMTIAVFNRMKRIVGKGKNAGY